MVAAFAVARALRRLTGAVCLCLCAWNGAVQAQAADALRFDIPREPLHAALEQYSVVTGRSLLYDGEAIQNHFSVDLHGVYTPDAALRELIAGTGLRVEYTGLKALMLMPAPRGESAPPAPAVPLPPPLPKRHYYALLQATLEAAFCREPATMPGRYRVGLRIWVDPTGALRQLELLSSTGDADRDARLVADLSGVSLGEPPPPDIVQPMTVVVLPKPASQTGDCRAR